MALGGGTISHEPGAPAQATGPPFEAKCLDCWRPQRRGAGQFPVTLGTNWGVLRMLVDRFREVPRGEKMLWFWTDPESYITEYTLVYEEYASLLAVSED